MLGGQQYDYGSNTNGQILGHNYVAYKYNRWGTFFSLMNNNVSATGLAPKVSLKQGAYFPNYTGGPKLILLGDGQWSNPSQGYYGWNMFVYYISNIARFAKDATGIAEDSNNQLSIFPNPTSDNFNVKSNEVITALKIYTITGQLILELNHNSNEVSVNTEKIKKEIMWLNVFYVTVLNVLNCL